MFGILVAILIAAVIIGILSIPGKMLKSIDRTGQRMQDRNHQRRMEKLASMTDAEKEKMRQDEIKKQNDRAKDREMTKQQLKDGYKKDPAPFILLGIVLVLLISGFVAGMMDNVTVMLYLFGSVPVITFIAFPFIKYHQKKNQKDTKQ